MIWRQPPPTTGALTPPTGIDEICWFTVLPRHNVLSSTCHFLPGVLVLMCAALYRSPTAAHYQLLTCRAVADQEDVYISTSASFAVVPASCWAFDTLNRHTKQIVTLPFVLTD
jgi:hypothetical protein